MGIEFKIFCDVCGTEIIAGVYGAGFVLPKVTLVDMGAANTWQLCGTCENEVLCLLKKMDKENLEARRKG